jgi:hypothetical protein
LEPAVAMGIMVRASTSHLLRIMVTSGMIFTTRSTSPRLTFHVTMPRQIHYMAQLL